MRHPRKRSSFLGAALAPRLLCVGAMRTPVIVVAALMLQGCLLPLGFFPLVVVPSITSRPEVCESCKVEAAEFERVADAIPTWMEESRVRAGPSATADRTGYFSWELSLDGRPVSQCGARGKTGWRCAPIGAPAPASL